MATKGDLRDWLLDSLEDLGGSANVIDVSKWVWQRHESELRASGDLFFTWQYDLRWEAKKLRDAGLLRPVDGRRGGPWELAR